MTVEDGSKRNVLVGIRFDEHAKELLDWAILKVADQGDCVTALHVCQDSGTKCFSAIDIIIMLLLFLLRIIISDTEKKNSLDDYLSDYEGLCNEKKVGFLKIKQFVYMYFVERFLYIFIIVFCVCYVLD